MIRVPYPSYTPAPLEEGEISNALLQKADSRSYPSKSAPDNRDRECFIRQIRHEYLSNA